jgi:tetrahydromethanopterin:alpha-L-glutamate ligase
VEGEGSRPLAKRAVEFRFGIVTAWPEEDWHSRRLVAACSRRGAAAVVDPGALAAFVTDGAVEVRAGRRNAASFDALLLARGLGRDGDPDVQFEIYRALEGTGTLVANRIDALLAAQDKLRTSWLLRRAGVPTPAAAAAQTAGEALAALQLLGRSVAKPITGSLGEGLVRVESDRAGRRKVAQLTERDGAVYLQQYVPHPGCDTRLFVVGSRVAGAMERLAAEGEWRTNVERGARVRPVHPERSVSGVAVRAAAALGLDWAGVDVVVGPCGPTVIEVNGNPGWAGILEATGMDMAESIAEHVCARARRRVGIGGVSRQHAGSNHG